MTKSTTNIVRVAALALAGAAGQAWSLQPAQPPATPPSSPPAQAPEAPKPVEPQPEAPKPAEPAPVPIPTQPPGEAHPRVLDGPPTKLGFKQASVDELVAFIVAATGKVVMPQQDVLTRRVTVLSDQPIPRAAALDLVYQALMQNGVAVVESDTTITLRDMAEMNRQDLPVIGPEQTTLNRTDLGNLATKVYAVKHGTAKAMADVLKNAVPDFAKMAVNEDSNQISLIGNIALLQRVESMVNALDRPSAGALQTETFHLQYADSEAIKSNIEELFSSTGASSNQGRNNRNNQGQQFFRFPGQQQQDNSAASSGEVRVTANTQQNSVTVVADPAILAQVREQIMNNWDLPLTVSTVSPKVYDLQHSDPVKVRDLLEGLFGRASSTASRGNQGNQGGGGAGTSGSSQGVGRLAGQFSFQAIPETGRLVVVAKSPDNLEVIDKIVHDLDQPQTVGLPEIVELKHASAEDLAEQLNALLAQEGTLAQIRRAETGLSATSANISPFSSSAAQTTTSSTSTDGTDATSPGNLSFWWQRARPPTDKRASSNLIGSIRIVPVWRQNALMVTAPPEYTTAILELISRLDRPGRQVLISAIVSEISSDDALSLGLRWGSQALTAANPDNAISIGNTVQGTKNNWATSLFDTSVLNVNTNVNLLLQALAQNQKVSILSEPRVFTSDNQEAEFFDGQDVSVPTNSQTTDVGTVTQTFDYRSVGIQLRVRPRITVQGDVDLRVNLQLSSIAPDRGPNNSFIFDRRQTTTQLILKNAQTIVVSGILRKEDSNIVRKVPLLGDIPLLGELFKSRDKSTSNTELLVFITPIVVNNTDGLRNMNEPYNERLNTLRKDLGVAEPRAIPEDAAPAADTSAAPATPVAPQEPATPK